MSSRAKTFSWSSLFHDAAIEMSFRSYDFKGLTRRKAENAITGLLAHELMLLDKSLFAFIEVPTQDSRRSSKPMEASSSNGAIKSTSGAGGKPDLFVMERENINWRSPNLYAEFKFLYCDDIDESGAFCSQPNYNEVLQDTRKLFTFSEISPNTTCVQGVYFCRNLERDAKAYPPKKHGAQEAQHENFVSYFKTEAIKLLGQSCEIPFNSVLELSARTGDSNRDFWLDLVLFEIRRR